MDREGLERIRVKLIRKRDMGVATIDEETLIEVLNPSNSDNYIRVYFEENPDMLIILRSNI